MKMFITGGISSGKSAFAEEAALGLYSEGCSLHFFATARDLRLDNEMVLKIKRHKEKRSPLFKVHENFEDLNEEIKLVSKGLYPGVTIILIDSLTMWLSSVFGSSDEFETAEKKISALINTIKEIELSVIAVSDSLGLFPVPVDPYLRGFIELNGVLEQGISGICDKSFLVVAGKGIALK